MIYGVIGLGHLGGHLASSLIRNGFETHVHDIDSTRADRFTSEGGRWAESIADLVGAVDAIVTCLPSPKVSQAVLEEILQARPATDHGKCWIEMSTNGRDEMLRLADMANSKGMKVLEAPVTGGVHLAARGEITVLCGGDKELLETHRPAFGAIGNRLFHMGPIGSAAVIKVITNMLALTHLVATSEALMLAKSGGLDLAQAFHAISASSGTSFVHETEGQLILNGSYQIDFTMDLAMKDLGFAMQFGKEFGVPLELAAHVRDIFAKGKDAYGGGAQSTQIAKLLEDATGTDLRAEGFPAHLE